MTERAAIHQPQWCQAETALVRLRPHLLVITDNHTD